MIKDRYRIYDEIGQGSMVAIYLTKDLTEKRVVALETLGRGKAIPTGMASCFA